MLMARSVRAAGASFRYSLPPLGPECTLPIGKGHAVRPNRTIATVGPRLSNGWWAQLYRTASFRVGRSAMSNGRGMFLKCQS